MSGTDYILGLFAIVTGLAICDGPAMMSAGETIVFKRAVAKPRALAQPAQPNPLVGQGH